MNDADLEHLLRSVRPAGPPPELRARILERRRPPRSWPWLSAAAALAVAIVCLQSGVERSYRAAGLGLATTKDSAGLAALRAALGDELTHLDRVVPETEGVEARLPELEIEAP